MKTSLMFLAALSLGTAAAAQDSAMQPGGTAPVPTTAPTMPDQQTPGTAPTTPAPADGTMPAPTGSASTMPAPAPAPDPAAAPAPAPAMPADTASSAGAAPQAATGDYPACSRTMKDKCIQKGTAGKSRRR